MSRLNPIAWVVTGFAVLAIVGFFWWSQPRQDPAIRQWHVNHAALPPLRIAVLGDFHFKTANDLTQLSRIKRQLIATNPDLVLFVGDYIDSPPRRKAPTETTIVSALEALAFPDPAFAVLGNHDHMDDTSRWHQAFADSAVILLENQIHRITIRGESLCIRGLGDAYSGVWHAVPLPTDCEQRTITLTHDPAGLIKQRGELESVSVAGHTHCGQIALPIFGPVVVPTQAPSDMHCGLYQRVHHGLTTGGLGTSILPFRWGPGTESGWELLLINNPTAENRAQ